MLQETSKIWMDGTFVDWKDANVHVLTHTLHYGLGVFEGIRCYKTVDGPAVFRLPEHVDRLFASAHISGMKIPFTKAQFTDAILETLRVNGMEARSEERRVGKECRRLCRSRWSPYH
jgi:branched-chain amino acid aminotransferase